MNAATQRALAEHTRSFYTAHAEAFSATRDHPWSGWRRVVEALPASERRRVLDAGCGNARLAGYLASAAPSAALDYTGIDSCPALLATARSRIGSGADGDMGSDGGLQAQLLESDLSGDELADRLPDGPFDLVCAFGLLHHIPGFERRRELIRQLAGRLATDGRLALAFWRFGERDRFRRRRLDWSVAPAIDRAQLEPGDHLLAWGDRDAARYCHACDDAEIDALLAELPLRVLDDFEADGKSGDLNRYLVLVRETPRA